MSGFNIPQASLTLAASALLEALASITDWEGSAKNDFEVKIHELVRRLGDAEQQIETVYYSELIVETLAVVL